MSREFRETISKRVNKIEEKWTNVFNQEVQEKISIVESHVDLIQKTFKENTGNLNKVVNNEH